MTWTYNTKAFRGRSSFSVNLPFTVSVVDTGGAADRSICLVDLDAEISSENPHTSGSAVVLFGIRFDLDVGSSTGKIILGFVKENDGTDGTLYELYNYDMTRGDLRLTLDFGNYPVVCSTDYCLAPTSSAYTVLQNDANYTVTTTPTGFAPDVGDLAIVYDHETDQYTRLAVMLRYSVI